MEWTFRKAVVLPLAASLTLSACATGNEGVGQALGTLLLGGACLAVTRGDTRAACIAAAAAGFAIGGAIGHEIDVRDRKRREAALAKALSDQQMWQDRYGQGPMSDQSIKDLPEDKTPPKQDAITSDQLAWHNPDTDNSGRIVPLRAYENNGSQQCRQVRESYFKNGEPINQVETYCKDAQGKWQAA